MDTLKACSRCKVKKPRNVIFFDKNPGCKDGYVNRCKECRKRYRAEQYNNDQRQESQRNRQNKKRKELKLVILTHYSEGTPKCSCPNCEETSVEFLGIDHIGGGGANHRREIGVGVTFYKWIIKNNFPSGLRVLCHNCNLSLGYYNYCPHENPELSGSLQRLRVI